MAPSMLDIGEIVVPRAGVAVRMAFQETFTPFHDIACRTAVGYVLANRGMMSRVSGDLDGAVRDTKESLGSSARSATSGRSRTPSGGWAISPSPWASTRKRAGCSRNASRSDAIGDTRGTSLAQGNLGNLAIAEGDLARAQVLLDDSAIAFRRRGDMWGYGSALGNLASLALARGDLDAARRLLEESLVAIRITGRARWIAWTLVQLAAVARLDGQRGRHGARRRGPRDLPTARRSGR